MHSTGDGAGVGDGIGVSVIAGVGVDPADITRLTAVTHRGAPLVFISSVQPAVNVSPLDAWMRSLSIVESLLTRMEPLNAPCLRRSLPALSMHD